MIVIYVSFYNFDLVVMRPHMEVDPNFDKNLSDGLELHTPTICIGCFRIYNSLESNLDTQQSQGQLQLGIYHTNGC